MKEKTYCRNCKRAIEIEDEATTAKVKCKLSGQTLAYTAEAPRVCIERGKNDGYEEKTRGLFDEV